MQSTNSEYGSPYLAVCHVTFTYVHNIYEFGIQSSEDFFFTNNTMVAQLQYQL